MLVWLRTQPTSSVGAQDLALLLLWPGFPPWLGPVLQVTGACGMWALPLPPDDESCHRLMK